MAEATSIPQTPRARSGSARMVSICFLSVIRGWGGAANASAVKQAHASTAQVMDVSSRLYIIYNADFNIRSDDKLSPAVCATPVLLYRPMSRRQQLHCELEVRAPSPVQEKHSVRELEDASGLYMESWQPRA